MLRRMIQTLSLSVALTAALVFPTAAFAWWDHWGNWHPNRHHHHHGHYDYHPSGHVDYGPHGPRWHDTSHYDYHPSGHHHDDYYHDD